MNEYVIATYLRLSLDDAVTESLSIPSQRLLLNEHIESLDIPNATVLEFVDNGYSGTNLDRPAMQEMLGLIESGGIHCIVTKDFSRFSRSAIESSYYIERVFPLYRIRFISVSDAFDSINHMDGTGGIEVAFKFLLHERYSRDLSEKVRSAKRVQMRNGENITANAIYGYRKNTQGKWESDPEPAEIVRRVFSMALEGLPSAQIRDQLSAERVFTPREYIERKRGKEVDATCVWTARMVRSILSNEQYTGMYIAGKQESKAVGSHTKIYTNEDEWIKIPDRHPPLVSKADYAAVQDNLSRYRNSTTVKPTQNPLADDSRPLLSRMLSGERVKATPIYGYQKGDGGKLTIDDTAAGVVREIYDMARQGLTIEVICGKLTEAKYPTPSEYLQCMRGHSLTPLCQWTAKCVRGILKNIQYTGAFVSGKILKDYKTGKSYHTAESDWIVIPDKHPAIIGKDFFDEVQGIMAEGGVRRKNRRSKNYLLRGDILKCGCCGYALVYDHSAQGGVYRCQHTLSAPDAACCRMKISARELDESVLTIIRKQAEVVIGTDDLSHFHKPGADEKQITELKRQFQGYEEQRQQCYERFILGQIDRESYLSQKSECASQIGRLNKRLDLLRQSGRDRQELQKAAALAHKVAEESLSPREVVEALIDKVFVFPGNKLEIRWKVRDFTEGF